MAFTQTQLDRLDRAITSGAKEVTYGNKKTVFHSLDEMLRLRETMYNEINGITSIKSRTKMAIFHSTNSH